MGLSAGDVKVIRDFLSGAPNGPLLSTPSDSGALYRYGDALKTRGGGYVLALKLDTTILVNLEVAIWGNDYVVDIYRPTIINMAEKAGLTVLPVSRMALSRVASGLGAVRVIHRLGLEAVLEINGAHYLSAYDDQENPPLYFLCRLPRHVGHVNEARYALRPASVNAAIAAGIPVKRQGDLFAIRSQLTDDQLREAGGKIFPTEVGEVLQLYGTSHTADRVAVLPDHRMLVSGRMTHDPRLIGESRDPDHHPLILDGGWWWVARNTVPIEKTIREARQVVQPKRAPTTPYADESYRWQTIVHGSWTVVAHGGQTVRTSNNGAQASAEGTSSEDRIRQLLEGRQQRSVHYHNVAYGHRNW